MLQPSSILAVARRVTIPAAIALAATAAPASAQQPFGELARRHLPVDAAPSTAVAVADLDGDGDADVVFGGSGDRDRLYLNRGRGVFDDATASRMPARVSSTRTVEVGDVDGDGDHDLLLVGGAGATDRLYLNDGAGFFQDVSAARLPAMVLPTTDAAFGDVDGDGDPDLALAVRDGANRLYRNDGGTFVDVPALPVDAAPTNAVAMADLDRDDDLDLVFGNGDSIPLLNQSAFYRNDGTGTFVDATGRLPLDNDNTASVALADVNGDGYPDIVLGNASSRYASGRNQPWLNNTVGGFFEPYTGLPPQFASTSQVVLGDVDADGDDDLLAVNQGAALRLYRNDGAGIFAGRAAAAHRDPGGGDRHERRGRR
ncbi:MAG: VCBS repeat-containing protein [Planctomycetota bacterium]